MITAKELKPGTIIQIGKESAKKANLNAGLVVELIQGKFSSYSAPSILIDGEYESIYHIFGPDLQHFLDSKVIEYDLPSFALGDCFILDMASRDVLCQFCEMQNGRVNYLTWTRGHPAVNNADGWPSIGVAVLKLSIRNSTNDAIRKLTGAEIAQHSGR